MFVDDTERDGQTQQVEMREAGERIAGKVLLSERQLRAVFDSVSDAILLVGHDLKYLDANKPACDLFGRERSAIVGTVAGSVIVGEYDLCAEANRLMAESEISGEAVIQRPDGQRREVEYTAKANVFPNAHLLVVRDVTERRSLQRQVEQAQKMEAVGRLAGGVAHDFNNMLTVIRGYAELLGAKITPENPLRRYVGAITNAADRSASMTQQLLAFSRRQVLQPRVLDLSAVVGEMTGLLQRLIGEDIELRANLAPGLGSIKADPAQMTQVVLNLVINARDAMPGGGKLLIETRNVEIDATYCGTHVTAVPGAYVMMSVTDTGCGMDTELKSHIFEPFFTTKEVGKGTGLGLATVYGIVKQSGGYIWVYSEKGEGTIFKIYLPRVDDPKVDASSPVPDERIAPGQTILVIEDEEGPREVITEYLRQKGYLVIAANGGDQALTICERHSGHIALVLTDIVMSGTNGQDLAGYIALRHPEAKFIYMSGFPLRDMEERGCLAPGENFLQKPFRMSELSAKITETLSPIPVPDVTEASFRSESRSQP